MLDTEVAWFENVLCEREEHGVKPCSLSTSLLRNKLRLDTDYRLTLLNPKLDKDRGALSDRANRAVQEQVLDSRIISILVKLMARGEFDCINGCISTGKEANVYHASKEINEGALPYSDQIAVKIYKSTILTFKNRDQYVTGEYRFRHGYCRHNPRKMVQVWAEKEMRNLHRLQEAGLPCPHARALKLQVLTMDFIGDSDGTPAPRLKDAHIDPDSIKSIYYQCLKIVRRMFHDCHLVHADFSEYNLLLWRGVVYVIDVGQAVEHDHPRAIDFLRADLDNLLKFFGTNQGCPRQLSLKEAFEFTVLDPKKIPSDIDQYLDNLHCQLDTEDASISSSFKEMFIPRTLQEVEEHEAHLAVPMLKQVEKLIEQIDKTSISKDKEDSANLDTDSSSLSEHLSEMALKDSKELIREIRKTNKKAVKEQNRVRRAIKKTRSLQFKKK